MLSETMAASIDETIDAYTRWVEEKKDLEDKLRSVKKQIEPLERAIVAHFTHTETQSMNRKGWTVYMARDISVKSGTGDTADVVEKIRKANHAELLGLNWPRIKAWVKERMFDETTGTWEVDKTKLPPSLRDIMEIDEYHRLGCRRS